ncbi:unnamed protein product [Peronospora belbahrii]|uniref:Uncharacterized protein n=1 Tax=Peronospora belbahrii TaxID=622444 RepID=A0ABN8D7H8_9STRA|nr:unnamed protein product [Peronospora belbahrii]
MARLNGSNRAAWNAMDLEIGVQVPPVTARSGVEDSGALSARNVLLRQKLRERKRYDSADDAMKKAAAASARATTGSLNDKVTGLNQMSSHVMTLPNQTYVRERPFSPAQMGQSAFFNAMESRTEKKQPMHRTISTSLYEPSLGGAVEGRNLLIQRKLLQSKVGADSVEYQTQNDGHEMVQDMEDTDMKNVGEMERSNAEVVSSPSSSFAATLSRRQQLASMSPSRAGKYGALENKKKSSRRDSQEQQRHQKSPSMCAFIDIGTDENKVLPSGRSDYGKLSAAHVLIRRKLKERKRFDSADYAMEKQGRPMDVPAEIAADVIAPGTTACGHSTLGMSQAAINHQVKHIKLSETPSGRAMSSAVGNAAQAALAARAARYAGLKKKGNIMADNNLSQGGLDRYGLDKSAAPSGAAAARNLVLQRKLAERKMFDSADHFKEAA